MSMWGFVGFQKVTVTGILLRPTYVVFISTAGITEVTGWNTEEEKSLFK